MVIRLSSVNRVLWFFAVLFLAFSFPLQVIAYSVYPALIPYALVFLVIFIHVSVDPVYFVKGEWIGKVSSISLGVAIYVGMVMTVTITQMLFGVIGITEGFSALFIYVLPVVFYIYFRSIATEREIKAVFLAIVVSGGITGLYFAYDSYMKLALAHVNEYAYQAFRYTIFRSDQLEDVANTARINVGSRSMGLLESHTVSGVWVILGVLAHSVASPADKGYPRTIYLLVSSVFLMLGLNFTAIIAFIAINVMYVYLGFPLFSSKGSQVTKSVIKISVIIGLGVLLVYGLLNERMYDYVVSVLDFQAGLILGYSDTSMAKLFVDTLSGYVDLVRQYPIIVLIGDGFSSFGMEKGGDIGLIETMARFGVPYFLLVVFGLSMLFVKTTGFVRRLSKNPDLLNKVPAEIYRIRLLLFSASVILVVAITEAHYSIWGKKSVLPIIFFSLALIERYMSSCRCRSAPTRVRLIYF